MDKATREHGKQLQSDSSELGEKKIEPYRAYIRTLLPAYPQLQILDDFIGDVDWMKWKTFGQPKPGGLTKFNVLIVDIEADNDIEKKARLTQSSTLRSKADVESYIEGHPLTHRESVRLFLIEDLSRAVIEYFGAKYKLDPQFFEGHLKGHERLKCGRPLFQFRLNTRPSPPTLSDYCTRQHFSVDYLRPYKFGDGTENSWKAVQRKRWQTANVMRDGDAYMPIRSNDTYYSRERFSVAYTTNEVERLRTGILLFDPLLPLGQSRTLPGYRNFAPIPIFGSLDEDASFSEIGNLSLRNDFLNWLRRLSGTDLQVYTQSFHAYNMSLLVHLFRVAAAHSIDVYEEIRDTIAYVELKIHGYWRDTGLDVDERMACDCIQILRYFITDSLECMASMLVTLKGRFRSNMAGVIQLQSTLQCSSNKQQQSHGEYLDLACDQLISDCEAITSNLENLKSRSESDINYFVARLSAKEVQKTEKQSGQLNLLNYIVFILGLLSALASILAIERRSKYTLSFVIASTLAIVAIIIAKNFGHIRAGTKGVLQLFNGMAKQPKVEENPFDYV